MTFIRLLCLCCAGGALVAGPAAAGGYVAPVAEIDVAPVPVIPAAPSDWSGTYAGASLGYSFAGDDAVGLNFYQDDDLVSRDSGLTDLDLSGLTADLHAGYRWQRNSWVFGPELAIEGGNVDDAGNLVDGFDGSAESKVNYIATLAFKTGYLLNPQTLVYGTAGLLHGDFDYSLTGPDGFSTESYTDSGYTLGLGVERKLSQRMSVFAEYQYRDFKGKDVTFSDGADSIVTKAAPKHQNLKLGVNFSF